MTAARRPEGEGPAAHKPGEVGPVCRRLVPWLIRHRLWVLGVSLVATLAGGFFSARLYGDLRSDMEELLPADAPSVAAAKSLRPKLHTVTQLSLVLEGGDPDAMDRFADDLAGRLKALPPGLVDTVEYRTDAAEAYLHRFGALYLSVEELQQIQSRIDARIAWEKQNANPLLNLTGDDPGPKPPLDFQDIEKKYAGAAGSLGQFRKGYFQKPDGRLLVMMIRPLEAHTGYESNRKLLDAVKVEVKALDPARYDGKLRVGYAGEVSDLVEEQEALISDLASSTVVVLALVLAALWLFFRRWSAILAIAGALAVGCGVTFGLAFFLIGYLNANTAFLGSIVVGNGINVSIIVVARYLEERRRGTGFEQAVQIAWSGTLAATFVASFGAGLAYLSLAITAFRGFSQFGVIGGLGMAVCWVLAYLLLPPLLSLFEGRKAFSAEALRASSIGAAASWLVVRHGRAVRIGSVVLVLASLAGIFSYRGALIQYDLDKLRAAKSATQGSMFWGKKVDQVFQAYLTPVVIRADTPAELTKVVATLESMRAALGSADPLRELRTLDNVIPKDQEAKLPLAEKLRATLTDARLALLAPELRAKVEQLRPPADLRPVQLSDLPVSFRLPLTERDGSAGRIALAFPRAVGSLTPGELQEITDLVRTAIQRSGAAAQAVGQSLLFADIAAAIMRDGPKATVLALALVCALVLVVFRKLRPGLRVIGGLLLGVLWLLGIAAAARVRLNFLNFVVLPITFGIGVDYAVNIMQRRRIEGRGSLGRVLKETGGAVALCSITTIIGYASLIVADNRALRGFGLMASLGEVVCLTAALLALPAWIVRRDRKNAT
jgi:predicted RND superfamily exporter protein